MKLSIVIPVRNEEIVIKKIINRLENDLKNLSYEIIFVNDFSTDNTSDVIEELIKTKGQDHNAIFYVRCIVSEYELEVEREAKSIKRAEQACAESLLERLASS